MTAEQLESLPPVAALYASACFRVHDAHPAIEPRPDGRFAVRTTTGFCSCYAARDLRNLTRALDRMAR